MALVLYIAPIVIGTWLFYLNRKPSMPKLNIPYLKFESDNPAARYKSESGSMLSRGYTRYIKKGLPFSMRDPNDAKRPMIVLPMKYIEEVKWVPEKRLSFWKHIDKQSILTQIGGPGITEEVALAARHGLNRALVHLIEPLQKACVATFKKEMPPCPEWTSVLPYPLIIKIFASMSACAIVGPELGGLDSEWQSLSMKYVSAALSAPGQVRQKYPQWLYWLSPYFNSGVKTMWKHRDRARELLAPVLQARIDATNDLKAQGSSRYKGPRKYEDGVQWLLDAHTAHGKVLTTDQLAQDLFVIMVASIHSTSGACLSIIFDMIDHPDTLAEIRLEIMKVQKQLNAGVWTRRALGELKLLDSFMRESARIHALTQYTSTQRIPTQSFTFRDGLHIPANHTLAFPSYHHNHDPLNFPDPETFNPYRHLQKRQHSKSEHKYQFASVSDDMFVWGTGRHACPGRFFAQETLKLLLIELVMGYEFKFKEGEAKERFVASNLFLVPNPGMEVLFRERRGEGE